MAKSAGQVTESLMSLSRTLATQVSASENTATTLVKSSHQISDTQDEFRSMSGHIQNSHKLLTKYGRRERQGRPGRDPARRVRGRQPGPAGQRPGSVVRDDG